MQVEAVVFDIGNVLVGWQPEAFYDSVIGVDRRKRLFAEVDLAEMNKAVDAGASLRTSVYACADRHPDWAKEIRLWHDRWIEMLFPRIEGSVALLRALRRAGVPVFALTNFGRDTFELARGPLEFLNEFDREYVSGRLGLMKPDPRIYAAVEADCGITPGALLFADDSAKNVAAAAERGWQVHHFETWEGWAKRLVAAGLLGKAEAGI
ncbi:HAD family phosphatase [Tabrizicola piscis]|uniref:HAD family phosphatase n=1 Tax=Tabrizicola piscis TaxID=2494374 RepID=A0A3S8U5I8_9RHOB|nr:HAD-IA family hydrolase [Tabrizicola piscis]AZL58942.1 HAD family phosphatase [Tabrizicola piscis]